jgi:hypothetical protein
VEQADGNVDLVDQVDYDVLMSQGAADGHPDQVTRRLQFEAAHPRVQIFFIGPAWQAVIPRHDGEDILTRHELRDLLNALEKRLEEPSGQVDT